MTARFCEGCGEPLVKPPHLTYKAFEARRFCRRECQYIGRPDVAEDYVVTDRGCWEWQGHVDSNGYGKCYDPSRESGQRVDWAHRVSYRLHKGDIPERHELDHLCENTICINPDHLDPVTKVEHARRTMQRLGKDELHLRAARLRESGLTYKEIAEVVHLAGQESAYEAVQRAIKKGLIDPAAVPPIQRLTDNQRDDIRMLYALGVPQTQIAAWYRVDSSQISRICNGMSSGHGNKRGAA